MSNEPFYDKPDRPRGILTESDREYILARGEGYSRQAAHARKNRIAERLFHGILDLALLADLPAHERQELFLTTDEEDMYPVEQTLPETRAALSFLYQLINDLGGDFEDLLADAIVQAEQTSSSSEVVFRTAEVNISEPESYKIDEMVEIVEDPSKIDELSRQELFFLITLAFEFAEGENADTFQKMIKMLAETLNEHWLDPDFVEPFYKRGLDDVDST